MTNEELKVNLKLLINHYVKNPAVQSSLLATVDSMTGAGDQVKAMLVQLEPLMRDVTSDDHAKLVRDIYFNFC